MRINWGYAVTAVYTAFAVGTLSVVVFAIQHPVDLVSADYYARSLQHDRHAEAASRGLELGDRVDAAVDAAGQLVLTLPRPAAPDVIAGRASLYRPSNAGDDRGWDLAVDATGRQILPTAGLRPGRWVLQIEWQAGGLDYYTERPVTFP